MSSDEEDAEAALACFEGAAATLEVDAGSFSDSDSEPDAPQPAAMSLRLQEHVLAMCDALQRWKPFGTSASDMQHEHALLAMIHEVDENVGTDGLTEVIRARKVMRYLAQEERDLATWSSNQLGAHIKRHYLSYDGQRRRGQIKLSKLQRILDHDAACEALQKTCGRGHTCLQPFVQHVHAVLRWRRAFYSLDKQTRLNHLVHLFRAAMLPHAQAIQEHGVRPSHV
jgi:hypothetical protein